MSVSNEFERQRLLNIQRNKELLKQLELDALQKDIERDVQQKTEEKKQQTARKAKARSAKRKSEEPVVVRRSKRIAGEEVEMKGLSDDFRETMTHFGTPESEAEALKEKLRELREQKIIGDVKLEDILTSATKSGMKDEKEAAEALEKIASLGKSISGGDFYDTLVKMEDESQIPKDVPELRSEIGKLSLYGKFDPPKLTPERIYSMEIHPTSDKKLIMVGDKIGHVGLWMVDETENDERTDYSSDLHTFRFHIKSVAKILVNTASPDQVFSCAYDGTLRVMNLSKLESKAVYQYQIPGTSDYSGLSDMNIAEPNVIYFTTLDGDFGLLDLRAPATQTTSRRRTRNAPVALDQKYSQDYIYSLTSHKIGGFAINPNCNHQIATGSLDRTLKIWDLRNVSTITDPDDSSITFKRPHCYAVFNSRLSVSHVDWNAHNRLVSCGYDDKINIFNLGDTEKWDKEYTISNLQPEMTIRHNCQCGRWVSILKPRWQRDPKDKIGKFAIANMNKFIDVYTEEGYQIGHVADELMTAVPAVCMFHPRENWLAGAAANGKIYLYS